MKKLILGLMLSILFIGGYNNVYAVVAYPHPMEVKQSDGTMVTVLLKGDEKVSWAKTTDNYTLLRSDNGDFVYAISDGKDGIIASNMICHNVGQRNINEIRFVSSLNKDLFFSKEQISLMKQIWDIKSDFASKSMKTSTNSVENYKMVVILMGYADTPFSTPREEVDNLFNQVGYSKYGHPGSVHDYFDAASFKQLNLSAKVVGPYTAQYNLAYYGKDTVLSYNGVSYEYKDFHVRELITEAVDAANNDVDFSQYTNNDGDQVSCVYVLYAGVAQSYGGNPSNTIWPHRSRLSSPYLVDGVYVYNYGCSSEFDGWTNYTRPLKIGTICHEFSHVLGQPDYYDTDYNEHGVSFTPEDWDIMASGNYNNNGMFPPLWSAMERTERNYITIKEVSDTGSNTLAPLSVGNQAYKLSFSNDEYYILENRQQTGWDSYIPGHGLLIYHVDKTVSGWNSNCSNCDTARNGYKLITADNSTSTYSTSTCFPGTTNNTSFTDHSSPNSRAYNGTLLNKPITSISENATTNNITFVYGDIINNMPVVLTNSVNPILDSIKVSATISNASSLTITERGICYSTTNSTPKITDNVLTSTSTSNTFNVNLSSVTPNTTYYVRAYAKAGNYVGYGEIMSVVSSCSSQTEFPYLVSFEENETDINCWKQEYSTFIANKWNFIDTTNISGAINNAHSGNRFAFIHSDWNNGTQTIKLVTNPVDISNLSEPILKFYHNQKANSSAQDVLKIYYKTTPSSAWNILTTYSNDISTWQKDSILLPNKSNSYFIGFESNVRGGYGIGLDDIEITDNNINSFPIVTTDSIEQITDVAANIYCNLVANGNSNIQNKGIVISENPNPTINDSIYYATNNNIGSYQININNLNPSTTYYVRSFARNNFLLSYGQEKSFITSCARISNFPYTPNINSGDTNCFVNNGGWNTNPTESSYEFAYSTDNHSSSLTLPIFDFSNKDSLTLSFDYKQLSSTTIDTLKVYYKANVASGKELLGTYSSNNTSFSNTIINIPTTNHQNNNSYISFEGISKVGGKVSIKNINIKAILQTPIVSTDSVFLASYNSISTNANVVYSGMSNVTNRGICYSTTPNPTINNSIVSSGNGSGSYTSTINNLPPSTTYYIKAFATNSYGTAYGEQKTIATPFTPIFNNVIDGAQTLCNGGVGTTINGSTPTGGDGTNYSYLWIISTDSINWSVANNGSLTTNPNFEPRQLHTTTYYRRIITSSLAIDTSNVVTITVNQTSRGGNIFVLTDEDSIRQGSVLKLQLRAYKGDIIRWERMRPEEDWSEISNSANSGANLSDIPDITGNWTYRVVVKNGVCPAVNSSEKTVVVKESVGLNAITNNSYRIVLSPNPSNGNITFKVSGINNEKVNIVVNDINGKIVYNEQHNIINSNNTLDLTSLHTGTYVISINNNNILWKEKIIIQR